MLGGGGVGVGAQLPGYSDTDTGKKKNYNWEPQQRKPQGLHTICLGFRPVSISGISNFAVYIYFK